MVDPVSQEYVPSSVAHVEHPPRKALKPFVSRMLHSYGEVVHPQTFPVPPTGCHYLSFVYGTPLRIQQVDGRTPKGDSESLQTPRMFIGGQIRKYSPLCTMQGRVGLLGVEFTPTGLHRLFRVACHHLTDRVTDLRDLLPARARILEAQLMATGNTRARFSLIQQLLLELAQDAPDITHLDRAVALVEDHCGRIAVETLAQQCHLSPRQLNRQFLDGVGIGPKHFAKVIQIKHAFAALQSGRSGELQSIAQRAGYYDQAHFIHDFQRFIGTNPTAFLQHSDAFLDLYLRHRSHQD